MSPTQKLKLINRLSEIIQIMHTLDMPIESLNKAAKLGSEAQGILMELEKEAQHGKHIP